MRIFLILAVSCLVALLVTSIYFEVKDPCVEGHTEHMYVYDPLLKMPTIQPRFVCDKRQSQVKEEVNEK